mgnify:CR=1 FL=1
MTRLTEIWGDGKIIQTEHANRFSAGHSTKYLMHCKLFAWFIVICMKIINLLDFPQDLCPINAQQTYVFPTNTTEPYNMCEIQQIICAAADIPLAILYVANLQINLLEDRSV